MTDAEMDALVSGLTYSEVGRLYGLTGSELSRRNMQARMAADEDGEGW